MYLMQTLGLQKCVGRVFCKMKLEFMEDTSMNKAIIYIHGKGGNIEEAEHYKLLFKDYDVICFDYVSQSPWDAKDEFSNFFDFICRKYQSVMVIANSIGAFFTMNSLLRKRTSCCMDNSDPYFIWRKR